MPEETIDEHVVAADGATDEPGPKIICVAVSRSTGQKEEEVNPSAAGVGVGGRFVMVPHVLVPAARLIGRLVGAVPVIGQGKQAAPPPPPPSSKVSIKARKAASMRTNDLLICTKHGLS